MLTLENSFSIDVSRDSTQFAVFLVFYPGSSILAPKRASLLRLAVITIGCLALVLLAALPVSAAPSLNGNRRASYDASASISFSQSCPSSPGTLCPMMMLESQNLDVKGTLGWTVTKLTQTNVDLNVSRDLTVSLNDKTAISHSKGSLGESVNLATRQATFDLPGTSEIDDVLSMAQTSTSSSLQSSTGLSSSLATLNNMIRSHPIYTAWWVNGPLTRDQKVPVLFLSTTVKDSTSIDLGSLGKRPAWSLVYNLTRPDSALTASAPSFPYRYELKVVFTFNYDQMSDVLLSATADIQTDLYGSGCDASAFPCPMTSNSIPTREFSYDLHASMKLASTSLKLDSVRMTIQSSGQDTTSNNNNTDSQSGTAGSSSGSSTSTTSPQSNQRPTTNPTSPGSTGSSSTQTKSSILSASLTPWPYWIIGIVMLGIAGPAGLLKLYKRTK